MFTYLKNIWRITAIRLSVIYTLIFGLAAVGVIGYMTGGTINVLRKEIEKSIDEEVQGLTRVYASYGIRGLVRSLELRSRAPGANLYVLTSGSGEIIGGNVPNFDKRIMRRSGWTKRPFRYQRYESASDDAKRDNWEDDNENDDWFDDDDWHDDDDHHFAIARILEVPNGMRVLVGRDIGDTEDMRHVISSSFKIALGSMLLLGLATWFFVGRRALKRIDQVSKSSLRIMGGDKTERLPISGSRDEFDRLSENLNHMLDRIHKLDDGLKEMSVNIAHDLKTPITRLRNKADMALSLRGKPSEREKALETIIADCDQIVRTFDSLLMISRVESGASVVNMNEVDAVALVSDVHELFEAVADEEGIKLTLSPLPTKSAAIKGNRELLSQALSNLIDNAIKYGAQSNNTPEIELSLNCDKTHCRISVSDNGPGISRENRERVRERFVRLDESRTLEGNGLGLSLVEAIIQLHGGELVLEDNNPGLSATLVLPVETIQ